MNLKLIVLKQQSNKTIIKFKSYFRYKSISGIKLTMKNRLIIKIIYVIISRNYQL